jgi:hypothetical protein
MRSFLAACGVLLLAACGGGHKASRGAAFTVSLSPGAVRLLPSAKVEATVVVTAGVGSGRVDLDAQGLGGDLSASLQPASLDVPSGGSAQAVLTLQASDTAPPAQRVVTVRATGAGETASADLRLDIPAAKVFPVTTFLNQDQANLTFLAYQDGNGPWTSVEGQGGVYKLPITDPAGRFGLMYGSVCRINDFTSWDVNGFFETLSDTQALYVAFLCNPQPGPPLETFGLGGLLQNASGQGGLISANSGLWAFEPGAPRYDLKLYRGTGDLVAAIYPDLATYVPSRFIVERGRVTSEPSTRDFDFGAEGLEPGPRYPISRPALEPGESLLGSVQLQTSAGQTVILGNGSSLPEYAAFPPSAAAPGDSYVYGFQASTPETSRTVVGSRAEAPGPLAPKLPTAFAPFQVNAAGGSRKRLGLAWSPIVPTPELHQATLTQRAGLEEAYWYVAFSRRWLGEGSAFTWTPPDLAGIPGFDERFLFRSGVGLQVYMGQSGSQAAAALPEPRWTLPGRGGPAPRLRSDGMPVRGAAFQVRRVQAAASTAPPEYFYATRLLNLVP